MSAIQGDSLNHLHVYQCNGLYLTITLTDFRPRVNENVVYIVSAVLFNNFGEVLMIQESRKEKGKGKWYLPAGRVDTEESYEVSYYKARWGRE